MSTASLVRHFNLSWSEQSVDAQSVRGRSAQSERGNHSFQGFALAAHQISQRITQETSLNLLVKPELFTILLREHVSQSFGSAGLSGHAELTHELHDDGMLFFTIKNIQPSQAEAQGDGDFNYMVAVHYNPVYGVNEQHQGVYVDVGETENNVVFKGMVEELSSGVANKPDCRLGFFKPHPDSNQMILMSGVKGQSILYHELPHFRVETGQFKIEEQAIEEELLNGATDYLSREQAQTCDMMSKLDAVIDPTYLEKVGTDDFDVEMSESVGEDSDANSQMLGSLNQGLFVEEQENSAQMVPQHT